MSRFFLTFFILGLYVYALIDLLKAPRGQVRAMPKFLWAIMIILLGVVGVAIWFIFGRPKAGHAAPGYAGAGTAGPSAFGGFGTRPGSPKPSGPLAPDDDPEFLKRLDEQSWSARMEQMRRDRASHPDAGQDHADPEPPPA